MTKDSRPTGAEYQFRSFRAGRTGAEANSETSAWLEAASFGFHEPVPEAEHLFRIAQVFESDERMLTGVYAAGRPARAWDAARPVATYGTFVEPLNVGGGRSLQAHLIATVTVRANHRRRGLLRALITTDLVRARDEGRAVAALSSMEATIYGRFGFGAATFSQRVEVDTGDKFSLPCSPSGTVEMTDPATLLDLAPELFDRFHAQTLGSVQRPASYPSKVAGIWAEDKPETDRRVRVALHYDVKGSIDGYVSYKVLPWESEPGTIQILDIVYASQNAYLGLWEYLASIDLVTRVKFGNAAVTDPLPWAMADRRGFKIAGQDDGLWLRILDPVVALEARSYAVDGDVRIELSDPLAIANGVYALSVRQGRAMVTTGHAKDATPDVSMDVAALGSLYLGGVRADTLARTGQIVSRSPAALDTFDALLGHREQPYCITHF
ncbi:MAG TPA: GNAT family N-acetyltransferase [Dermatophilaceae bacterium]